MKKIALSLSAALLLFMSCDKVSLPIVPKTTAEGSVYVKNSNAAVSDYKKVLLEDYTGQRCPNCPSAASLIKGTLSPQYSTTLIPIAVHQGNTFAKPFGEFKNDFRTTAGESWGAAAGFGIDSWPTGLINRKNYNSNGIKLTSSKWSSIIPLALADPFVVKLNVSTEYDTTTRALNVFVKGTFKTSYPNAVKLCAIYTEDGLVGPQDNQGTVIEEYEFEHMVRGDINGTWGIDLTTAAAAVNDSAKWSVKGFALPLVGGMNDKGLNINDKNVSVVVFAYDAISREVLQAEKVKIR